MKLTNWSLVIYFLFFPNCFAIAAQTVATQFYDNLIVSSFYINEKSISIIKGINTVVSFTNKKSSLVFKKKGDFNEFVFTKEYFGKAYSVYVVQNIKTQMVQKVGLITHPATVHFSYGSSCKNKNVSEQVRDQLKQIADFVLNGKDVELNETLDTSCRKSLLKPRQARLTEDIIGEFVPSKSFLMKCLNNKKAAEKISRFKGLYEAMPAVLDNYLLEINAVKNGSTSFKVSCETVDGNESHFNGKYDDKTKSITFPVSKKELVVNPCFSIDATITHEFMHHAGLKTEGDLKTLESICMETNRPEVFKNPNCKKEFDVLTKCLKEQNCNGGMPEAVKNAVSKEAKKDRETMIPALKAELKDIKLENVNVSNEHPVSQVAQTKISSNNNSPTLNTSNNSGGFNSSMRALSSAVQTNMNRIGAAVDKAIEATVQPAVASTATAGTSLTTKSSRLDLGSGKSSAKFRGTQRIASGSKSGDIGPDEYVAEEIIADKYGVPLSEVQKVARSFENEGSANTAPSGLNQRLTGTQPSEVSGSTASGSDSSMSSSGPSLAAGTESSATGPSGNSRSQKSPVRGTASVSGEENKPSLSGLGQTKELMGLEYQKVRRKYDDPTFVSALNKDNVRIHVKTDGRKIGSRLQDATVYIDSGRSLVRKNENN